MFVARVLHDLSSCFRMLGTPRVTPASTYRLQLSPELGFNEVRRLAPYLESLGITHAYLSPIFKARPGSAHRYDISDHNALDPDLGEPEDFTRLVEDFDSRGMGLLLDFVPNHMGIDPANPWWSDVLENGEASAYATFFDIDWHPAKSELDGKILLPILEDQYGVVLERGDLSLELDQGRFLVRYGTVKLPFNPREVPKLLSRVADALRRDLPEDDPSLRELLSITTALNNLPRESERDPERIEERRRESVIASERLARLLADSPALERHLREVLETFNSGTPESVEELHQLLEGQVYRLASWRTAADEINYRRFFDVNDLAGLRVEDRRVFEETHALLRRLLREGTRIGIRIDHLDGLFAPRMYLQRLQQEVYETTPPYTVVEKIVSLGERLNDWLMHGTTGYDFLAAVNALLVDPAAESDLTRVYRKYTGHLEAFADVVHDSKKLIMRTALSSELNVLAQELNRISEENRRSRDFTINSLRDALSEYVACLPVYRTYVDDQGWSADDREHVVGAIDRARRRNPALEPSVFDFLLEVILPRPLFASRGGPERRTGYPPADEASRARRLTFSMKLQQYTGPVHAKGVEDTAFYRYNALVSLNEVGSDPRRFGLQPSEFHALNEERRRSLPVTMNCTATHDTKLGEDARARLAALSELPREWQRQLSRWSRLNTRHRTAVRDHWAPDRRDECRFYQVLLAMWPPDITEPTAPPALVERLVDYMRKATKEAKRLTSWISPNREYDEGVARFVRDTLQSATSTRFLNDFLPFARRLAELGAINSLSQVVIKIGSPGVPDFYQGSELWDLNLVDPDNRRPVDFEPRQATLDEILCTLDNLQNCPDKSKCGVARDLLERWPDGKIKMHVTAASLRYRTRHQALFLDGTYEPLQVLGMHASSAVAFARGLGDQIAIIVAARLTARIDRRGRTFPLAESWDDTRIRFEDSAHPVMTDLLTGNTRHVIRNGPSGFPLAQMFSHLPVAFLVTAR